MNIKFARFASEEETKKIRSLYRTKDDDKKQFTNEWLASNKEYFLECYDNFPNDYRQHKLKKAQQEYEDKIMIYEEAKYMKCVCGYDNQVITGPDWEFIGCKNYRDNSYYHTKIYKPHLPSNNNMNMEMSSIFMDHLKMLYQLPNALKVSILYDFVKMNNRELYAIDNRMIAKLKTDSERREEMVKEILMNKFNQLAAQKYIYYLLENTSKPKYCIPDFICRNNNSIYIIEQKKGAGNINLQQTELYKDCVEYICKVHKITLPIKIAYIVEFEDEYINKDLTIIPFSKLLEYQFD